MPNHAYHATAAPGVVQRARSTKAGRKLERGGYLTAETVTMWVVYALTLVPVIAMLPVSVAWLGGPVMVEAR